jgi:hypothetical protein
MAFAYLQDGQWVEATGFVTIGDLAYPPGWAEAADPAARAEAGFAEIVIGQTDPLPHQVKTGEELVDVGGQPMRRGIFDVIALADRKAAMLVAIRAARWAHEQGGFTGPQGPVRTDDATQAKITGAVALMGLMGENPPPLDWELSPGVFASITLPQLKGLAVLIGQHVQTCFTRSRQLSEAVMAATKHTDLSAIDIETGWPS